MGHLGDPAAITPNLDAMVKTDAVSFSNTFSQNPVCTPSRCSFMTGWYPHVRGHRTIHHMLHRDEPELLRTLKTNGYYVWWGGKNDLIPASDNVMDHCSVRFKPGPEDYKRWGMTQRPGLHDDLSWRGDPGEDNYYSFFAGKLDLKGEKIRCDFDWSIILGVLDFLKDPPRNKPLCLYLSLGNPHPPYGIEEPYFNMIDRGKIPLRIPEPDDWSMKPSMLRAIRKGQGLEGWSEDCWNELRAVYYGMCARVDHQFGLVMNALKEAGIYNETAVFFFSDHGDFAGNYGLVEKTQNTFEDCLTRVPLLIKPPSGVKAVPGVRDALVELVDFPATVEALTGIPPAHTHFGRSLLPLLADDTLRHRNAVFCEGGRLKGEEQAKERHPDEIDKLKEGLYWPRLRWQWEDGPEHTKAVMVRTKKYKYVRRLYEQDELYDLEQDPGELVNRIEDPLLKGVGETLKERLLTFYQETCDVVPLEYDDRN